MLQDILPRQLDLEFKPRAPRQNDFVLVFEQNRILLEQQGHNRSIPSYGQLQSLYPGARNDPLFLFSLDETGFFLADWKVPEINGLTYQPLDVFREMQPSWLAFAGATAGHLAVWLDNNRYCGKCAAPLRPSLTERALVCGNCAKVAYPAISPAVIVGIMDGERLLMTRYADRAYTKRSLVAGYMEIGEALEDTVRREVMEEVGLRVRNIRYYKSQPWAFSQSMLVGFFADLDGSPEIRLDTAELSEAVWVPRAEIREDPAPFSLTQDMIQAFRNQLVP